MAVVVVIKSRGRAHSAKSNRKAKSVFILMYIVVAIHFVNLKIETVGQSNGLRMQPFWCTVPDQLRTYIDICLRGTHWQLSELECRRPQEKAYDSSFRLLLQCI